MKQDLVEFVFISDRSGSMGACQEEAQNAINRMIDDQRNEEGECRLTFVEFDDVYDVVHDGVDIKDVPKYTLIPRGMTAMCDAVGKAITTVGARLAQTPEEERPSLVTVVISTDGFENASKEYSYKQVADMIKEQREKYSWQFVFLGVEIDEKVGTDLGIDLSNVVNLKRSKTSKAYGTTSDKLKAARQLSNRGACGQSVGSALAYSDSEKFDLSQE